MTADTPTADRLRVHLGPIAAENSLAALMLYLIDTADDPEEAAQQVTTILAVTLRDVAKAIQPFKPLVRMWYDASGPN